jgi:hypothetical protein
MRRLLIAVMFGVMLAVPGSVSAKAPPKGFSVCGCEGCAAIGPNDAERLAIGLFYNDSRHATPTTHPSEFFVLRWRWSDVDKERAAYFVPSVAAIRFVGEPTNSAVVSTFGQTAWWANLDDPARASLARAAAGLKPFTTPRITRVTVGGRKVRGAASYLRIWAFGTPVSTWDASSGWLRVKIKASAPSPWGDSASDIRVTRGGEFLTRDATVFRIPPAIATRIRQRLPLPSAP